MMMVRMQIPEAEGEQDAEYADGDEGECRPGYDG